MINAKNTKIRVAALLDGRPGHEKQTMGIIKALQRKEDVHVFSLHIDRSSFIDTLLDTCRVFLPVSGRLHSEIKKCDFIIGTGTQTHLPLLLYKKQYNLPAIICMSPASYLRSYFDICFVPIHDGIAPGKNIFVTHGAPNCSQDRGKHNPQSGMILLGGTDTKSHIWKDDDILSKLRMIIQSETKTHWTIASSPRTPENTIVKVRKLSEHHINCSFYHYKETKSGWIEEQYDKNTTVWVTSDSISMIYEARTAGCDVGLLPLQWKGRENKFRKNEQSLLDKGLVRSFLSWQENGACLAEKPPFNEAQRCAEHILEKLWQKNSQ